MNLIELIVMAQEALAKHGNHEVLAEDGWGLRAIGFHTVEADTEAVDWGFEPDDKYFTIVTTK